MKDFFGHFIKSYSCKTEENGIILSAPVMYPCADHAFSFYIEACGNGFRISDRGQTLAYLRENLNPAHYAENIRAVCERFEITLENGVFYGYLASYASGQTMRNLHKFIGAMHLIANIDIF